MSDRQREMMGGDIAESIMDSGGEDRRVGRGGVHPRKQARQDFGSYVGLGGCRVKI